MPLQSYIEYITSHRKLQILTSSKIKQNHSKVVGSETVNYYELPKVFSDLKEENPTFANGTLVRLSAEKRDFFVLNNEGKVFTDNNDGLSDEYIGCECFDWKDLVLIDAAKVMIGSPKDPNPECELTIAGIQSDGTVLACGPYAEEILSWGKLNYISMDDSLIVGLTPDGKLKVTGQAAEFVKSDLEKWSNITGVKAGNLTGTTVVNAIDGNQNYYHLEYDERWLENNAATVSLEKGCNDSNHTTWYRYCTDGTVLSSNTDNGTWEGSSSAS